ncbi:MAG TPA: endopeptidase La [Acholeplasmataceae bacterium]|jgi:ATP-dependent Lon protease|nr:endopeptidase La [Acholeplasmataceae bacterium]
MFSNQTVVSATLPAMAIRGRVPLPNNEIRIDVGRKESILALKEAVEGNKYIALFVQLDHNIDNPGPKNVSKNGIIAKIIYNMEGQSVHKVKLLGIVRCKLVEFVETDPFWNASIITLPIENDDLDKELAYVRLLIEELQSGSKSLFEGNAELASVISQGVTADKLTDVLAYNLPLDLNSKMKYLKTPNVGVRLRYMLEDLKREKYIRDLETDIENEVRKSINESQKEYYLREKMKVIQDELGDRVKKDSEIEEMKKKILASKMPKTMEEKALHELNRYSSLSNSSGESAIIKTYLDFVISLPWYKESKETNDIVKAKDQLDKDHYGLDVVKDRILEYLAVRIMTKKNPQAILCFVGPPGVGKTSLARSIAASLNKQFVKQSLGGIKDEAEIRGHRRTYLGALPGRILQGMKRAAVVNPVFLLDEIDKLSSDYKGDPASAMLEVLDAEQNRYFSDHYLEEPYDLSKVFFICTANYLENIPVALRDRLEIVQLSSYTEFEKFEIAKRHLIKKQLMNHGLDEKRFGLSDDALWMIIRNYTKEAGVRDLERKIGTLIRRAIKTILMEKVENVEVNEKNLNEWLGRPKYTFNRIDNIDKIGVATGLAYTAYGGDTLQVEVTYFKGGGKLVLTGKLGDVMKESAQAALSYVKANAEKFNIDPKIFKNNDIHIHVPEGAVPKDGPSAGITIATALISALSHRLVKHDVGMTGEITLRGRVLPIGGIREKAIAAHRSGLIKILIPKENLKDVEDIPESVRKELEIVSIETIDDVVGNILV